MDLNQRKMQILKSIIDEYIDKGEPVGSKHLVEYQNLSLSPATIRNEMSELEKMGYLDKPHTSAGRIPSNEAYRVYIEKLMESYMLNVEELSLLNELTTFKMSEMDKLIKRAGRVISEITNCASLSLVTTSSKFCVSRYDALLIDDTSFLLVMVLPSGETKSQHIRLASVIDENDVKLIKNSLNETMCNVPLSDVSLVKLLELEKKLHRNAPYAQIIVKKAYETLSKDENVTFDGITNLLSYPEFKDVGKVKNLISLVEEKSSSLKDVFKFSEYKDNQDTKGLKVYIGDESNIQELSDASVVFCSLPVGNNTNAHFGIIGPKRMDYKKVISALKALTDKLEETITPELLE